jgi:hypothetical protein
MQDRVHIVSFQICNLILKPLPSPTGKPRAKVQDFPVHKTASCDRDN